MDSAVDKYQMTKALQEAEAAYSRGEFPVGCVIVQGGDVVASGSRTGTSSKMSRPSEIDHAEIRALKSLERSKTSFASEAAVLYCTMEPCLMCFGAIILSGIRRIVYAYEDVMGGGTGCDVKKMTPLYQNSGVEIVPGVLRAPSLQLFEKFFLAEDNLYWKNSLLERYTLGAAAELRK